LDAGIALGNSSNNHINNTQSYNNNIGIKLDGNSQENDINNSLIYNNDDDGINI
jgi:hypothetical protein